MRTRATITPAVPPAAADVAAPLAPRVSPGRRDARCEDGRREDERARAALRVAGEALALAEAQAMRAEAAEAALRAREAEFAAVMEMVPFAVWFTHDPDVRRVRRNRAASALLRVEEGSDRPLDPGAARRLDHVALHRAGAAEPLAPADLPLQRAVRGEDTDREEYDLVFGDGAARRTLLSSARPLRDPATGRVVGAVSAALEITERRRAEERQRLLALELNHRVRNTLATVGVLAARSLRDDLSPAEGRAAFAARLAALSKTHDLLTASAWAGAELREVLAAELSPYDDAGGRSSLDGAGLWLGPRSVLAVGLAAHELATNAAKHGALSAPGGRVAVSWGVEGATARVAWRERGGPAVAGAPGRRGFGTRLLESSVSHNLGGTVRCAWEPEGLACELRFPLEERGAATGG